MNIQSSKGNRHFVKKGVHHHCKYIFLFKILAGILDFISSLMLI